jgi:hypothetical protein
MKVTKKIKKLEEVKQEEVVETPVEESNDVVEEREVIECSQVEETTEAPTELPKVEFNEEIAPKGYSTIIPHVKEENPLKMKNGRVYKEIGNGMAMFLDNGSVFRI